MDRETFARLNPLRVTGTALPPNLLLAAKVLVFGLYCQGYVQGLPETWLPMWPVLDELPPAAVQWALEASFFVGALALTLNRGVRSGALLCGLPFLLEGVVTRTGFYYANAFCGCFFVLVGLYRGRWSLHVLHGQFVVMYLGSGLNKLLDPDWWSGHYMDYWLGTLASANRYDTLQAFFPEGWLAWALSWGSILGELLLAALFLCASWRPRWSRLAVWGALLFHSGSVLFVRNDFGIFILALFVSYWAFVPWPPEEGLRVRIGSGGLGRGMRSISRRVDFDRVFRWDEGTEPGRPLPELVLHGREYRGLAAMNVWLLLHPLTFLVFAWVMSTKLVSWEAHRRILDVVLVAGVLWFLPWTQALLGRRFPRRPV